MASAYGIHLGNSSACLAAYINGAPSVLPNNDGEYGDRITPAIVALNGAEWEIGLQAKSGQPFSKSIIKNNKRLMNCFFNTNDLLYVESSSSCRVQNEEKLVYEFKTSETKLYSSPDDIATKLYAKLFTIASHSVTNEADLKLVLAVPLHWSKISAERLMKCAELAGFDVVQIISEAAAAILAYNLENVEEETNILIFRLGGSTCDATIASVSGQCITVQNYFYRSDLGGQCLTNALADYIAQEFQQEWKLDPQESKIAMAKLLTHADNCKHDLSTLNSADVFIESLLDGVDWSQNVTRVRFENIISSHIASCIETAQHIIDSFDGEINKIILCGGSMKIPKLQSAIVTLLPEAEVLSGISPDELISVGCTKKAGKLVEMPDFDPTKYDMAELLDENTFLNHPENIIEMLNKASSNSIHIDRYTNEVNTYDEFNLHDELIRELSLITSNTFNELVCFDE